MYTLYIRIPIFQLGCRHVYVCVRKPCAQKTPSSIPRGSLERTSQYDECTYVRVLAF